ncbi:MAG: nickel-dependent lactate racemase [Planctomycetota bacterium]|nr:nickel-dependent lactate racemase [Planctomycetota bacterium]
MDILLPYGTRSLKLRLPDRALVLRSSHPPPLPDPVRAVEDALVRPIASPPLERLARERRARSACVVVPDATRPMPGPLLLPPILKAIEAGGIRREAITILIATGMHRPSTAEERVRIVGREVLDRYRVSDHEPMNPAALRRLDRATRFGTRPSLNRIYLDADLKVITGLVEPHFMAGFSGGRKAICPGIADLETISRFHGPRFLENPKAASGILDGNPCHEEALDIARIAGCDFAVNVTLDGERRLTGIFAGGMEAAHAEGVAAVRRASGLDPVPPADIVITTGGGHPLDATFYQTVKGMVEAAPLVKPGGRVLVVSGCNEGIGSDEYRRIMAKYADGSYERFLADILAADEVIRDQWQFEMHIRLLRLVGVGGIVLATDGIAGETAAGLCVTPASALVGRGTAEETAQRCLDRFLAEGASGVTVLPEGPYVYVRPGK